MIDKLQLAKALEGGPIDRAKAEAIANAIGDHVKDLDIAALRRDNAVLKAMGGLNLALTTAILFKLFG